LAGLHLDRLLAGAATDAGDLAVDVGAGLDKLHHPQEVLEAGAELVGGVDLEPFTQDGEAAELASLEHTAFPALAADDEADLEG
jgi:hypothetical protein